MKRLLIIFIFLFLFSCHKDEPREYPIDCNCGYIVDTFIYHTNDWLNDDWGLIRQNDCTNNLDTIWWMKEISGHWEVGDYICTLKEIDIDSLK